jgi:diguanylate cyclase (GGDEF)-like protein
MAKRAKGGPRQVPAKHGAQRARQASERAGDPGERGQGPRATSARRPSAVMRLVVEVDALRADLAAARASIEALEASAHVDMLTGALNRRGFERELARALAYARRYATSAALIYLDLDGLKPVNDTHGHAAGDALLQAAAAVLHQHVRASDIVGRLGGDEFAVLLWRLDERQATAKARALESALAQHAVRWQGNVLVPAASAGIAMFDLADTAQSVLTRADRAMYARKVERGRPA